MKKSKILREAKKILAKDLYQLDKGGRQFLCHAIEWVSDCKNTEALLADIDELLGENSTVALWLVNIAKIDPRLINVENMMTYRHRWIDHLITRYEAKGE